jgi:hypothetical protein
MTDESRNNASAEGWLPEEGAAESAYEGRQPPDPSETLTGTRVARDAPPTGGGRGGGDAAGATGGRDANDETVREGGGAPGERA